jgi:hypothetical protein
MEKTLPSQREAPDLKHEAIGKDRSPYYRASSISPATANSAWRCIRAFRAKNPCKVFGSQGGRFYERHGDTCV